MSIYIYIYISCLSTNPQKCRQEKSARIGRGTDVSADLKFTDMSVDLRLAGVSVDLIKVDRRVC
jgi:hypothetical protein